MASTYTPLGVEKMTTGENAGTWGDKTNTNLQIIEQFAGGFTQQAVTDGADTTLSVTDGNTGATLAHRVIEFTGSLSASFTLASPFIINYENIDTGSNITYSNVATGSNTSYSDVA